MGLPRIRTGSTTTFERFLRGPTHDVAHPRSQQLAGTRKRGTMNKKLMCLPAVVLFAGLLPAIGVASSAHAAPPEDKFFIKVIDGESRPFSSRKPAASLRGTPSRERSGFPSTTTISRSFATP
jgi:hypothetical protein